VSIATQLSSTSRWKSVYSDPPTQLDSTSSCVAINGP